MSNENNIRTWHQTIDFESLMREARKHITHLAGNLWTDHNASDPGITQLEVLAFCIADLSYRTSFDVKDIITGYKGDKALSIDLPLADTVLPNNPVSIKDLRKVLIDMPHPEDASKLLIRNAFPIIAEQTEVPFYAVSKPGQDTFLSFDTSFEYNQGLKELIKDETAQELSTEGKSSLKKKPLIQQYANAANHADNALIDKTVYQGIDDYPVFLDAPIKKKFENIDEIILNGLYSLQIEFEDQNATEPHLKDLNQNYFKEQIEVDGQMYTISVLLPYWDDIQWSLRNVDLTNASLTYRKRGKAQVDEYFIAVDKLNYDDYFYDYYAELNLGDQKHKITAFIKIETKSIHTIEINGKTLEFDVNFLDWNELSNGTKRDYDFSTPVQANAQNAFKVATNVSIDASEKVYDIQSLFTYPKNNSNKTVKLLTRLTFNENAVILDSEEPLVLFKLEGKFQELFDRQVKLENEIYLRIENKNAAIYTNYLAKINRVFDLLYFNKNSVDNTSIWKYLGNFRNVCEDYSKFSASRIQEIALFGKLDIAPDFNVTELLAEIYFQIDQFLSPLVKFNALSEMLEKQYSFEEIFNGPLLTNGFIEHKDLEDLKRRSVVYTSDLIRIIMDVPGVKSIEDFNISSYIDNRLMGRNVINCLSLTNSDVYKPRFSAPKTAFKVCMNGQSISYNHDDIHAQYLEKINDAKKVQISLPNNEALFVPEGDDMEIEKYKSIQHDFPEIYGIGDYGLPADASDDRKARAKQLKAFLLPFEQLLANYLKQVAHLPELFSFNKNIETTYAYQPLYDVPDVQPLFADFATNPTTWDAFKQDLNNTYNTALKETESDEEFRSRRNRFLSHLLSRFGESFEAYATQMFDRHKSLLTDPQQGIQAYQAKRGETLDRLIEDKIAFAEDYQKVSAERYKSFDATKVSDDSTLATWNNSNIESYKLRLCRLLGIKEVNNRFLFGAGTDDDGMPYDIEGMHIVEHILLRPRTTSTDLLSIENREKTLPEIGSFVYESDKDPYSFRITIVLPKSAERFKEEHFRNFMERLIRMETPAHIHVDFNWMGTSCGKRFEQHYSAWKKSLHELQPHLFQGISFEVEKSSNESITNKALAQEFYTPKAKPRDFDDTASETSEEISDIGYTDDDGSLASIPSVELAIISLQNNLIDALNTPCELSIKAYNGNNQAFIPFGNQIIFEDKTTDIYHIRVSEIGGTLRVYKYFPAENWVHQQELIPVTENYFSVAQLISTPDHGLTNNYGGVGNYKVVYEINGAAPVEILIEVTPTIIPAKIFIGDGQQMLSFDTEKDGLFSVSTTDVDFYFLEFFPEETEGIGQITISSPTNGMTPQNYGTGKNNNLLYFQQIYDDFGAGQYHITYSVNGQTTFADIEIVQQLKMGVYSGKTELMPDRHGTIVISRNNLTPTIHFSEPGGKLEAFLLYDPRSTELLDNSEEAQPVDALNEVPLLTLENAPKYIIDRNKNVLFEDGVTYLFRYTLNGKSIASHLYFEPLEDEVPSPDTTVTIKDLSTEEEVLPKEDIYTLVFDYSNAEKQYELTFNTAPGVITMHDESGEECDPQQTEGQTIISSEAVSNGEYQVHYQPMEGNPMSFLLDVVDLNPTFTLAQITPTEIGFKVTPSLPYSSARTYIWRLNGKYTSRAKKPTFSLDFNEVSSITIELTMHYDEYEAAYEMTVTPETLENNGDDV